MTVGDDLEVLEAEFRALDVARWARLELDISAEPSLADVHARLGAALADAAAAAEGRLLAARVVLTGASDLHAALRRDLPGLRAECINQAQRLPDGIWIEDVEARTTPRQNLAELAARDDLSRVVLESLDLEAGGDLAEEIGDLLKILPAELREGVEAELAPERQIGRASCRERV